MFRPSRRRSDQADPHLLWKVRLFALGAVLAVAGIALDFVWLRWTGIAVLAAALLLRFLPDRRDRKRPD